MASIFMGALVALFSATCARAADGDLSNLASTLAGYRDACAAQAGKASTAYSTAIYQAGLDADVAVTQAQADADVYRVGHGRQQTLEYLAEGMRRANEKGQQEREAALAQSEADAKKIVDCTADAESRGKDAFAAFRKTHKSKGVVAEAQTVTEAWLTNLREISLSKPQGSEAADAAWKAARSHADLSE